jgi:hypothetical protein
MRRLVIGEPRGPGIGEAAGRVEADKIGAGRGFERHDPAMRAGREKQKESKLDGQQDCAGRDHATPGQLRRPVSGPAAAGPVITRS